MVNFFEDKFFSSRAGRSMDERLTKDRWRALLENASRRAEEILSRDAIDPGTFKNYNQAEVAKDTLEVSKQEQKFEKEDNPDEKEAKKIARILEAIIHEQVELCDWLGTGTKTVKTSRYDDVMNGVDEIVVFKRPPHDMAHLALSIDVTYSTGLKNKFDRIKRGIDTGQLGYIKYFKSEETEGDLKFVPKVIVGVDMPHVRELVALWMVSDKKRLAFHPVQHLLLREIADQAEVFSRYARSVKQDAAAQRYDRVFTIMNRLKVQKERTVPKSSENKDWVTEDRVFADIQRGLKEFL